MCDDTVSHMPRRPAVHPVFFQASGRGALSHHMHDDRVVRMCKTQPRSNPEVDKSNPNMTTDLCGKCGKR